jgi:hypothetical protein
MTTMRKTTTAALCGTLLGFAFSAAAHAQTYRYAGPQISTPDARTYVVIDPITITTEQPQPSATSRDAAGRPTHGALGTGDVDQEMAMNRDDSYTSPRTRRTPDRY